MPIKFALPAIVAPRPVESWLHEHLPALERRELALVFDRGEGARGELDKAHTMRFRLGLQNAGDARTLDLEQLLAAIEVGPGDGNPPWLHLLRNLSLQLDREQ